MSHLDASFAPLLEGHDINALERERSAVFAVDDEFRLTCMNPGWFRFAEDNGGHPRVTQRWTLGEAVLPAISPVLRGFFESEYRMCLEREAPWIHQYEGSTGSTYRTSRQVIDPLPQRSGLLLVNMLMDEMPHDSEQRPPRAPVESSCRNDLGVIVQRAHCRQVSHPAIQGRWDWIPEWVDQRPKKLEFGLCVNCEARYHSGAARARAPPRRPRTGTG